MSSSSFFKSSGTSVTIQNTIDTLITDAEAAKTSAETAATNAASSASLSSTYANNSSSSATNAANSLNSAQTAQSAAETAETNAETAQTAAETAETNAASSASTASTQASNASTSATAAASSASTASTKASEASTSATNAATSETNAATSATNAASSATTASGHASTASTQASNASTSATNAASSASAASTSETNAATSESNASTSATNAATSASTASTQATNASNSAAAAATSATNASNSATAAASSATTAQSLSDSFNNIYLGALSSAPSQDPDGSALDEGDLYYDTTQGELKVYKSSGWAAAGSTVNGTSARFHYDITTTTNTLSGADANGNTLAYDAGYVDVFVNGVRMSTADVTTTSGNSIVFADNLVASDDVDIVAYGTFVITQLNADNLDSGTVPDARITGAYTGITNLTMSGNLTVDTNTLYVDSANNRVGVGTSSPLASFETHGQSRFASSSTSAVMVIDADATSTNGINIQSSYYGGAGYGPMKFTTGGSERMRIDSSGNVGIGVVPETWTTSLSTRALQVGDVTSIHEVASQYSRFASNMYYDGTFKYITSNPATRYTQQGGTHVWDYASSGSADGAITFNEAMRIDSSGNLLVGKTSTAAGAGAELRADGQIVAYRSNNRVAYLDRLGSDGNIVEFLKDNSTVGSIGSLSGAYLYMDSPSASFFRINGTNEVAIASAKIVSPTDGRTDLGSSSERFKDLYLSGGVYLGGTGSANYLDDYEEGTYTATFFDAASGGNQSPTSTTGYYTKIGDMVFFSFNITGINITGLTSGNAASFTLPFTSSSTQNKNYCALVHVLAGDVNWAGSQTQISSFVGTSATRFQFYVQGDNIGIATVKVSEVSSADFYVSGQFRV